MSRRVKLEGATNFRDLGGYQTVDGRTIKSGWVYRSDGLHRLTDRDHQVLADLSIRLVCDLRYGEERAREPSRLPAQLPGGDALEVLHLGLDQRPDKSFADSLDTEARTEAAALEYLTANYRQYPHLYADAYRTMLTRILALREGATVFHCTAGKDRAGFAAVVVLLTLGVPYETVRDDYLKTNRYWDRGDRSPGDWPAPVVEAIFTAREEYLREGLSSIDEAYGSFDEFLTTRVGFTPERRVELQDKLLD